MSTFETARRPFALFLLVAFFVAAAQEAAAQEAAAPDTSDALRLTINAEAAQDTISRHLYGLFAEHLGRDIYGGFWVQSSGADSAGADAGTAEAGPPTGPPSGWQYNEPVIEALRQLEIPNLRWPGGCFADYYHWRDGIGPRAERPTMVNTIWGGVTEDNSFGTHEFLELTERLETEPFVVGNVGSGTVEEMADWWEYVNHPGGSSLADLRAENGRQEPWGVRFWGVGNESWGCGGSMTPEYYADLYKRFATFLRPIGETRAFRVATGPNTDDYNWTEIVMRDAGWMIDGLDLHYYTTVGPWENKGSATDFGEAEWFTAMSEALRIDTLITHHSAIMDEHDPEKRVALIVGEWGMWHDALPGTEPGFLYQQNTLRDALVAAIHFDVFNRHADRVRMAELAQTINVLQALILTQDDEMIRTPTYHVFDLYKAHQDAQLLPIELERGTYTYEGKSVPALSASASRKEGQVHVTMTNMDPNAARTVTVALGEGLASAVAAGRVLTADSMQAHNTFEAPEAVTPTSFEGAQLDGNQLTVELPPKSIVALELR